MSTITRELAKLFRKITNSEIDAEGNAHVVLSPADSLLINNARIALASLEAEAVGYFYAEKPGDWYQISDGDRAPSHRRIPLYAAPPAQAAMPECFKRLLHHAYGMTMGHDWNKGTMAGHHRAKLCQAVDECRAAMLQGSQPVSNRDELPDDFISMLTGRAKYLREKGEIKSPELLERAAAALQGGNADTTAIPNGWKLVPIDPTKDMLRAGQSVVGFWLNTVHCYSKMLAAAPAAPQQEAE